jgi:hypothetical protein
VTVRLLQTAKSGNQMNRITNLYLFFSRKKSRVFFFSRFLELTSQNNFARLNSRFFSRFTYLEFFHPPILVKISQDFLSQGNLEIFCLNSSLLIIITGNTEARVAQASSLLLVLPRLELLEPHYY